MSACQNVRCASFTIRCNWTVDVSCIVQTVTGTEPVCDLRQKWFRFCDTVVNNIPEAGRSKFMADHMDQVAEDEDEDDYWVRWGIIPEIYDAIIMNNEPALAERLVVLGRTAQELTDDWVNRASHGLEVMKAENERQALQYPKSSEPSVVSKAFENSAFRASCRECRYIIK